MRRLKKALIWCALLTKRLYKKPTFVAILILIPLLALGYGLVADEDSGMVTIALAREDNDDTMAAQIVDNILNSSRLIRFISCESPEDAESLVRTGQADGAWIFEENIQEQVFQFIASRSRRHAFVRVVEREQTVPLLLAREKLSGEVFECCSRALYLSYIRENVPELAAKSDEQLLSYYDEVAVDGVLFEFSYIDAEKDPGQAQGGYLVTPVRGMLAVVVVLCGMATAMYYVQDTASGTFAGLAQEKRCFAEWGCQMISAVNVSIAVLISLTFIGSTVGVGRELLIFLLYCLCTALFCMVLRRLAGSLRGLGMLLPLLTVVMLVVCPVFFDLGMLRRVQYLFPPTYYINAAYNDKFLLYMPLYAGGFAGVYYLIGKLLKRA